MTPRDFEFFVAEIFEKLGFSVKITQATRDGGKDIIATKAEPIPYTLIVECKHWGVFCKPFLDKVAKHFWTLLHVQIGQSCKVLVSLIKQANHSLADII